MGTHTRNRVTNALQCYVRQRGRPSCRNSIPLVLHNDNEDIFQKTSTVQVLVRSGGVNHLLKAPFWGHGQPLIWHYQERLPPIPSFPLHITNIMFVTSD
jgi:hypothetical protein